jgi:hypothetical protein
MCLPPLLWNGLRFAKNTIGDQIASRSSTPPIKLDFIVIGAEKAGTTLIQRVLQTSGDVYMPAAEVRHFRDPFYGPANLLDQAVGHPGNKRVVGIRHPSYLGTPESAQRIHDHNPSIKLVVSLRDPVERIISAYFHYFCRAQIPARCPDRAFQCILSDSRDDEPKYQHLFEFSRYHSHLQRFIELFGRDQILILEFERLATEGDEWVRLFDFLGVSADVPEAVPCVNIGEYDWNTCLARYVLSSLTEKRDRWNNIIGHRPLEPELEDAMIHIIPTMMRDLSPMNVNPEVSESTICALRDAFQSEVDALVDSGLLIPKGWRHYPLKSDGV